MAASAQRQILWDSVALAAQSHDAGSTTSGSPVHLLQAQLEEAVINSFSAKEQPASRAPLQMRIRAVALIIGSSALSWLGLMAVLHYKIF